MALQRIKLGKLIHQCDNRNTDLILTEEDVRGISTGKEFISTKADLDGVNLKSYKIIHKNEFAYVADTSRRGEKIATAFNRGKAILISSVYTSFYVDRPDLLLSDYLFMYFNRPEFDRYSRFNSWGSARETFNWEDMCDIEIELPSIDIQKKYVDVYNAMLENQKSYERGLDDLKLVCEAMIEKLKNSCPLISILPFLTERKETNSSMEYSDLVGVGNDGFIIPRGQRDSSTFYKCNIFYPRDFVYNPSVISKGAIAFNSIFNEPKICTEEYIVFNVKDERVLSPEYLFLWMKRSETMRYMEFMNIDSVRNRVYFKDLENIHMPIPDIKIQNSIASIFKAFDERKIINEKLKSQLKDICPILIKGSIEEAKRS